MRIVKTTLLITRPDRYYDLKMQRCEPIRIYQPVFYFEKVCCSIAVFLRKLRFNMVIIFSLKYRLIFRRGWYLLVHSPLMRGGNVRITKHKIFQNPIKISYQLNYEFPSIFISSHPTFVLNLPY